jgi:beta-lactamase regulating signal transducer with metallopeptidase domain
VTFVSGLLDGMLWNACEASLLAVLIALGARVVRLSAPARHMLWLLVLGKLIMPPLAAHPFGLSGGCMRAAGALGHVSSVWKGVAEPPVAAAARPSDVASSGPTLPEVRDDATELGEAQTVAALHGAGPDVDAADAPASWTLPAQPAVVIVSSDVTLDRPVAGALDWRALWRPALVAAWLSGALAVATRQIAVLGALWLRLRRAGPAPAHVAAECAALAGLLGLRQCPKLRVLAGPSSPMVLAGWRPWVVLPVELLDFPCDVRRSVLLHELAHLKRRDHWVCWLELAVSTAYWWLPTVWWARRELRRAADQAADAWAVWALGCRRRYAESLLQTVEILSASPLPLPALGRSLGQRETIARRLTMIMREPLRHRLSWPARIGTALLALLVLPAAPQRLRGQDPPVPPPPPDNAEIDAALEALSQRPGAERPVPPRPPDQPVPQRAPEARPGQPPRAPEFRLDAAERGRGPRDPDRRLQELEEKVEMVLQEIRALRGGEGRRPDGPPSEDGRRPYGRIPEAGPRYTPPPGAPEPVRVAPGDPARGRPGADPLGDFMRRLSQLDLTPEQRERIEHMNREFHNQMEAMARRHHEAIREILNPEQRERLEQPPREPERRGR